MINFSVSRGSGLHVLVPTSKEVVVKPRKVSFTKKKAKPLSQKAINKKERQMANGPLELALVKDMQKKRAQEKVLFYELW
jgi:hypothetical protein